MLALGWPSGSYVIVLPFDSVIIITNAPLHLKIIGQTT